MKGKQQIKIIKRGYVDIDSLTIEQQKTFYATLLVRILELYKNQKDAINIFIFRPVRAEVYLNSPLPNGPDESQAFLFTRK